MILLDISTGAIAGDKRIALWNDLAERIQRGNYKLHRGNKTFLSGDLGKGASSGTSKDKPDKPDSEKADRNNNQTPSGKNPPSKNGAQENLSPKNVSSQNSNTNTTLGLFVTTLLFGGTSGAAHFTNVFGEGNLRNFIAFGSDCGGIFTGALTLSSALAPVGSKDDTGAHEGVINPSAN